MLIRGLFASKLVANSAKLQCCSKSPVIRAVHQSSQLFDDDNSADDRPHMYQLEHVQKRIEACVPDMFQRPLDYTIYREDVVLDNQIHNFKTYGRNALMNHLSLLSFGCSIILPYTDLEALNIIPLLDDGTVRFRWRVRYQNWWTALSWRNFRGKVDFEKSLHWYDGYSIFYVDGNGMVFKLTIQKCMPNDDKTLSPKKIAQKIVQKAQPAATNPATAVNKL